MQGGDSSLDVIRAERVPRRRIGQQLHPFGDEARVPAPAILVEQAFQVAGVVGARRPSAPRAGT